jgi:hypothetical protein
MRGRAQEGVGLHETGKEVFCLVFCGEGIFWRLKS